LSEKTLLNVVPCTKCGSKDVRFRVRKIPHHLCRVCGNAWSEANDED